MTEPRTYGPLRTGGVVVDPGVDDPVVEELAAALRSFTPDVTAPRLTGGDVAYALHDSPVGRLVLAVDARGAVLACSYDSEDAVTERLASAVSPRVLRRPDRTDGLRRQLDEYFAGHRRRVDVAVDLALAAPFTRRVLLALPQVPYGSTTSYGQLATAIGAPRAGRAVGNALGANPVCIVLPCHRVVRADGAPGGYAGGTSAKQALLHLEDR